MCQDQHSPRHHNHPSHHPQGAYYHDVCLDVYCAASSVLQARKSHGAEMGSLAPDAATLRTRRCLFPKKRSRSRAGQNQSQSHLRNHAILLIDSLLSIHNVCHFEQTSFLVQTCQMKHDQNGASRSPLERHALPIRNLDLAAAAAVLDGKMGAKKAAAAARSRLRIQF